MVCAASAWAGADDATVLIKRAKLAALVGGNLAIVPVY